MSVAAKDTIGVILAVGIVIAIIISLIYLNDIYMTSKGFVWVPEIQGHWELPKNAETSPERK